MKAHNSLKIRWACPDAMNCADVRQLFIIGFWIKCVSIMWHPSMLELSVILSRRTCIVCKECQYVTIYWRCKFSPKNCAKNGWCWVSFGWCVTTGEKFMSHRLMAIGWSSPKMCPDGVLRTSGQGYYWEAIQWRNLISFKGCSLVIKFDWSLCNLSPKIIFLVVTFYTLNYVLDWVCRFSNFFFL